MQAMLKRGRRWMLALVAGGSLFVLESCDTTVRDTVLTGVGTAATTLSSTFISAFIESLQSDDSEETASTVRNFDELFPQVFG